MAVYNTTVILMHSNGAITLLPPTLLRGHSPSRLQPQAPSTHTALAPHQRETRTDPTQVDAAGVAAAGAAGHSSTQHSPRCNHLIQQDVYRGQRYGTLAASLVLSLTHISCVR